MENRILGLPIEVIDWQTCYLTYNGAINLLACSGALEHWSRVFSESTPLNVDIHLKAFTQYNVAHFLCNVVCGYFWNALDRQLPDVLHLRGGKGEKMVHKLMDKMDEFDRFKTVFRGDLLYFKRVLKAIIIQLVKNGHIGDTDVEDVVYYEIETLYTNI